MTTTRTRCLFCFAENTELPKLTREHLMSRPVAVAFGIDRTAPLLRTDGDLTTFRWTTVNGVVRKGVCGRCNSGWMKDLEHRMTDVAEWMKGSPTEPLGEDRELTVRSWAIKTHMLLCFIDGDAARLGEDGFGHAVVAPFSLARALYEGDRAAIEAAGVGIALSTASTNFAWAFGYPSLVRTGPSHLSANFAPASIVTIGSLQIWTVTPHVDAAATAAEGVVSCSPTVALQDLRQLSQPVDVTQIVVDYGDHDAPAAIQALAQAAADAEDGNQ
jgi:hypothetical protein